VGVGVLTGIEEVSGVSDSLGEGEGDGVSDSLGVSDGVCELEVQGIP
jgi:hypothetical protein